VPEALVEHEVFRTSVMETLSRSWMAGAFPALVREVPELRDTALFGAPLSLGSRSRLPLYATVAAALVGCRRAAVLGASWWATTAWSEARRQAPSRTARALALPVVMATDLITAVALVTGSVRARTVVV
jgi:hypothetical protein